MFNIFTNTNNICKVAATAAILALPALAIANNPPIPSEQDWDWVRKGTGCRNDRTNHVNTDPHKSTYAAGSFHDSTHFYNRPEGMDINARSAGNRDAFLAKYDKQGFLLWVATMGGSGDDEAWSVTSSHEGIYVSGHFTGSTQFNSAIGSGGPSTNLVSLGAKDAFVAKYTPDGTLIYAFRFGGASDDQAWGVASTAANHLYVTGSFNRTVNFKGNGAANQTLVSAGGADAFMLHMNFDGELEKATRLGGLGNDYAYGIDDQMHTPAITGHFEQTMTVSGSTKSIVSKGGADIFLARFDRNADLDLLKGFGGTGNDIGRDVSNRPNGEMAITGYFNSPNLNMGGTVLTSAGNNDVFVANYKTNGNLEFARSFGGAADDQGRGVAVNQNGEVYVTGYFIGTATDKAGVSKTSAGDKDVLLWKLDRNGNTDFVDRAGGEWEEMGRGIYCLGQGVVIGGMYSRRAVFGDEEVTDKTECGSGGSFVSGVNTKINGAARMGLAENTGLHLFPNPATAQVMLSFDELASPATVRIFDAAGRLVRQTPVQAGVSASINLEGINRGVYTVEMAGNRTRLVLE